MLPKYKYLLTYRYAEIIFDLETEFCVVYLSPLGEILEKATLPKNPEEAANLLLTLSHQETYLLSRQIASLEEKFLKEGGYTENLYKKRTEYRKLNKD